MKSFCEANGAELILVSTPSTKNWNAKRHNRVQLLSQELGIEYIDMNTLKEEIPINWKKDSRDKGDHLNYRGAKKVTAYLSEYLKGKGLSAHEEIDICNAWNEALKKFKEQIREN